MESRKRHREFTGCWTCRTRKVKCDGGSPCQACQRRGISCDNSSTRLVWIHRNQPYRSSGRRYIRCETTWADRSVLDSDAVDALIAQCDEFEDGGRTSSVAVDHNPFSVFSVVLNPAGLAPSGLAQHPKADDWCLFHHYVQHVAAAMMPFEHPRNPWKRYYPAVALQYSSSEEKALYHAILVHAAFNLVHLGNNRPRMMWLAAKNYNAAIQHVNDSIQSRTQDYGTTLASIMTLMMAEVYSGQSKQWKHHLQGAWAFLHQYPRNSPWNQSQFACFSTQSLVIVRIIGETCLIDKDYDATPMLNFTSPQMIPPLLLHAMDVNPDTFMLPMGHNATEGTFTSSIAATPEFGFTIGAQKMLLDCISLITAANRILRDTTATVHLDVNRVISHALASLEQCQTQINSMPLESEIDTRTSQLACYQLNAFVFATYIYLYRTLLDVPPEQVAVYVSLVFENILASRALGGGNFSLWPAFIAAVEVYTDQGIASACSWMEQSIQFGLGNRLGVKRIVEEIWRRRDNASLEQGKEKGLIGIDWREVIADLEVDILLV